MDDKEAIEILQIMLEKYTLSSKEKEAILTALGILSWSKFGKTKIKHMAKMEKEKRDFDLKPRKILID